MFASADYVLRPLTGDDEMILREMLYHALSPANGPAPSREIMQRPEYARYVEGWGRPADKGYVVHDKDGVMILGAVWLREPVECQPGDEAPELAFVVRAGHRHRGIGASLLTQLARTNPKFSAVRLQVGANSPAVRLLERFGFEIASQNAQSVVMRRTI